MLAQKIIDFNNSLNYTGKLPDNVSLIYPFGKGTPATIASEAFYTKYYSDTNKRKLILNNSPSRFGTGNTGVHLTDSRNLKKYCDIDFTGYQHAEPSSIFFYDMITAYGGVEKFYSEFYVSAVFPICMVIKNELGHDVNYTYYDDPTFLKSVQPNLVEWLKEQIAFPLDTSVCYVLGETNNYDNVMAINQAHHFFDKIVPMSHPVFEQRFQPSQRDKNIQDYVSILSGKGQA